MPRLFWFSVSSVVLVIVTLALVRVSGLRRAHATDLLRVTLQKTPGQCSNNYNCQSQVEGLLRAGADPNGRVASGSSFLLFAAHRRDTTLMRSLEARGAHVTPEVRVEKLVLTANGGQPAQIQALLDAGTPINARAFDGRSALEVAVKSNETNGIKMPLVLLRRGADARQKTRFGLAMVPLTLYYGGDLELIRALQEAGAPTSSAAALDIAAISNDAAQIQKLLDVGAPVDGLASPGEWTALQWAANAGHSQICELLLEHGADPLARAKNGRDHRSALEAARGAASGADAAKRPSFQRTIELLKRAEKLKAKR